MVHRVMTFYNYNNGGLISGHHSRDRRAQTLNESWTPENTDAKVPKASNVSNFSTNTQSCKLLCMKMDHS